MQSVLADSFFNMQNYEAWSSTTYVLNHILRSKQVRGVGIGYTFPVFCFCQEGLTGLYPTWKEGRMGMIVIKKLQWWLHCRCIWNFSVKFCAEQKKLIRLERGLFSEELWLTELLCTGSKTYCCVLSPQTCLYSLTKVWTKVYQKTVMADHLEKIIVDKKTMKFTSRNRCIRTKNTLVTDVNKLGNDSHIYFSWDLWRMVQSTSDILIILKFINCSHCYCLMFVRFYAL